MIKQTSLTKIQKAKLLYASSLRKNNEREDRLYREIGDFKVEMERRVAEFKKEEESINSTKKRLSELLGKLEEKERKCRKQQEEEVSKGFKLCTACHKSYSRSEFVSKRGGAVTKMCKGCREKSRKYKKTRDARKKTKQRKREYQKERRQNNPIETANAYLKSEQKKGNYIDKESYDIKLTALVAGKVFRASEKGEDISKMNLNEWRI